MPAGGRARRVGRATTGAAAAAWAQLGEMGVLGAAAPERTAASGSPSSTSCSLLEETGYAALPEPLVEHAAVGVPLLAAGGHDAAARRGR